MSERVAIVAGAGRELGRATAEKLAGKDALLARAIEDGVIKPGEIMPYQSFARTGADRPSPGAQGR